MDSKIRIIRFICLIRDSDNFRHLRNPNPINSWTLPFLSCLSYHLENFDSCYKHAAPLRLRWFIELMDSRFHASRFTHPYPRNLRNPLNP